MRRRAGTRIARACPGWPRSYLRRCRCRSIRLSIRRPVRRRPARASRYSRGPGCVRDVITAHGARADPRDARARGPGSSCPLETPARCRPAPPPNPRTRCAGTWLAISIGPRRRARAVRRPPRRSGSGRRARGTPGFHCARWTRGRSTEARCAPTSTARSSGVSER